MNRREVPYAELRRRGAWIAIALIVSATTVSGNHATRQHDPNRITQMIVTSGPDDRGGLVTIGGDAEMPREANAVQLAKLARARQAVERSRLAGTLWVSQPVDDAPRTVEAEAIDAMKLERLRRLEPLPYDPSTDAPPASAEEK